MPLFAPAGGPGVPRPRITARRRAQRTGNTSADRAGDGRRLSDHHRAAARRRANLRARDVAKAHFDLAHELEQRGTGSRLNALRAQQEFSIDDGLVESAQLAVYRAQEALGVLMVADGPVDATDEPSSRCRRTSPLLPRRQGPRRHARRARATCRRSRLFQSRADLQLFSAQQQAAERVLRDSSKDYWPYLEGIFQPQSTYPAQFFAPSNTWRLLVQMSVPIFDSGQRAGVRFERQAALDELRATYAGAVTQATSEIERGGKPCGARSAGWRAPTPAADQAGQVVNIINVSFRAGAATNIEVIDAERSARDADTSVAVAEDTLRRAKFELLTALGRFP